MKEATVEEVTERNKNELQQMHERQIAAMKAQFKRDIAKLRSELTERHALQLSKLIQLASRATNDQAFGLRVARFVEPTSLHALGFSLLASQSGSTT